MPPSPAPDVCLAYLMRHGATDNNVSNPPRLQGRRANPPLSDAGRAQVLATAQFLADQPIQAIYASPMRRAVETAELLANPRGLNVEVVDALIEADLGDWEGRTWPDIARDEPERYEQFVNDPGTHGYGGGENFTQVCQRAVPALKDLMRRHLGQIVLVVAHNVVNRAIIAHALGVPMSKSRGILQSNCGLNVFRYRADKLTPLSVNSQFHLPHWEGVD